MKWLIPLLIAVMLVSGCESLSYLNPPEPKLEFKVTGNNGLIVSFWKDAPPERIFEDSEFAVRLNIRNGGATDVGNMVINTIVEEDYISFEDSNQRFISIEDLNLEENKLLGISDYNPGDRETFSIDLKSKPIGELEAHNTKITVNTCYDYETEFGETICIDTDVKGYQEDKPCTVQDIQTNEGQGAPIMIHTVNQQIIPTSEGVKITFDIGISNEGTGNVIAYGALDRICGEAQSATTITPDDLNIIEVDEVKFSNYRKSTGSITCSPEKFNIGKYESIKCTTTESLPTSMGTYTTQLYVKLKYGYYDTISRNMVVENQNI